MIFLTLRAGLLDDEVEEDAETVEGEADKEARSNASMGRKYV